MALVKQDIREIRQCVYGRDMREPIADALVQINSKDRESNVTDVDTTPISGHDGYFTMTITLRT